MFGYTIPIESALPHEDRVIYRNYYCETCHHLREEYGFIPTLTVNYEMTFAAIFFNSILDEGERLDQTPKKHFCIIRHSASDTELMHRLTAYSALVANNSLLDDKMDDGGSLKANLGLLGLNRAIRKAKEEFPEYNEAILRGYDKLREIEASGELNLDKKDENRKFKTLNLVMNSNKEKRVLQFDQNQKFRELKKVEEE